MRSCLSDIGDQPWTSVQDMQRLQRRESGRAILATSILLFSRIPFVLPQHQLWRAPFEHLSLPSSASSESNNRWVLKSSPPTKRNPWRDSGSPNDPWVHESGLEYRDVATIEAARSVARFAKTNQYLGSFKTRRGQVYLIALGQFTITLN